MDVGYVLAELLLLFFCWEEGGGREGGIMVELAV